VGWSAGLVVAAGGVFTERASRAVNAFVRLSAWMAVRGLGVADLDEDVFDEHIRTERQRSGARSPAAAQYLPRIRGDPVCDRIFRSRGPVVPGLFAGRQVGGERVGLQPQLKRDPAARRFALLAGTKTTASQPPLLMRVQAICRTRIQGSTAARPVLEPDLSCPVSVLDVGRATAS
jgi:hypothetical protein